MTAVFADTFYCDALADFTDSHFLERDLGPVTPKSNLSPSGAFKAANVLRGSPPTAQKLYSFFVRI
jgi:hypothetical protein